MKGFRSIMWEKFPTENRAQRGKDIRIGPYIYKVVVRIGDWHLVKKIAGPTI